MSVSGVSSGIGIRIPDPEPAPPVPPPTATIDGNDGDAIRDQRKDATTTDGHPIQIDELYSGDGVEIRRERTHALDKNGNVVTTGDQVVVDTTGNEGADDRVEVRSNPDGTNDLYVNGERYPLTLAPGQEITIKTGDGDDVVWVDSDVDVNIVVDSGNGDDFIMTGAGNDRIDAGKGNDTVYAGAGRDDVFGNSGDDHLSGGDGDDVVYGGDGNDFITGTTGNDYLEGGVGEDTLWGGAGDDILSGGRDNDRLEGDSGNDTVYTGLGADSVENSAGKDKIYAQQGEDTITIGQYADKGTTSNVVVNVVVSDVQNVTIDPNASDAFRQRVQADIDMINASPVGTQLFADIDASGHTVVLSEITDQNGYTSYTNGNDRFATPDGPGPGTDAQIGYNPSFHTDLRESGYGFPAPVMVLYHELSHAWNGVTGTSQPGTHRGGVDTGQNNRERQAVGLPTDPPAGEPNPEYATENGFREELGYPDRPSYAPS